MTASVVLPAPRPRWLVAVGFVPAAALAVLLTGELVVRRPVVGVGLSS